MANPWLHLCLQEQGSCFSARCHRRRAAIYKATAYALAISLYPWPSHGQVSNRSFTPLSTRFPHFAALMAVLPGRDPLSRWCLFPLVQSWSPVLRSQVEDHHDTRLLSFLEYCPRLCHHCSGHPRCLLQMQKTNEQSRRTRGTDFVSDRGPASAATNRGQSFATDAREM